MKIGTFVIPIAYGVSNTDANKKDIIGDNICRGMHEQEYGYNEECSQSDRSQRDVSEVFKPLVEPFYPEKVGY